MYLGLMPRYDVIWVPVLTDIYIFAVSYILYGLLNAVVIAPICILSSKRTANPWVGLALAFAVAVLAMFLAEAARRGQVFFIFLAIFLMTWASFHSATRNRRSKQNQPAGEEPEE